MRSMEGVLKEELLRLKAAEQSYLREIGRLPKGSIQEKVIKGIAYPYLVQSLCSRLRYRYLGGLPKAELEQLKKAIAQKRRLQKLLREIRSNKRRIERILYGRKKAV